MIPIPLPSELEGKDLIGSRWVRRMGKHRGVVGTLISFNDAGCKLEIRGRNQNQSHMGDVRFGSIQWPMLMNLYTPEGTLKDMIITVDKNDFVVAVQKESEPVVVPPKEGIAEEEEMVMPVAETRLCVGPWHRKAGKGTQLPIAKFGRISRGPHAGELTKTCMDCMEKRKSYTSPAEYRARKAEVNGATPIAKKVETPQQVNTVQPETIDKHSDKGRFQWKVTILKPVEVTVWADDFLSAGVAAGDGEVSKVERV